MALDLDRPNGRTDEHVVLVKAMTGTQRKLRCDQCGYESLRGEPAPLRVPCRPSGTSRAVSDA